MKEIARELLLGIEPRGQDATGMAWFGKGNGMVVDKSDVNATRFVKSINMRDDAPTAILHTRLATTGKPENNRNNHPVVAVGKRGERVVLTHNGWVNNAGTLTKRFDLKRRAEVDTEAIAAFLQKFGDDYTELGQAIDGNYAVAYLREDQPGTLRLVRGHTSPLVLMQTVFGWFYASTEYALRGIQEFVGGPLMGFLEVAEGRALEFKDGEYIDSTSFDLLDTWSKYYGNQVHKRRSYTTWDDEWETGTWRGNRTWVKDPDTGVFRIGGGLTNGGTEGEANKSFLQGYTDTKRGVRVYYAAAADERAEFLGMLKGQGNEHPSAYGKWVWTAKQGAMLEFYPWPGMAENYNTEESVLEDLLFLTVDMEPKAIPDSIRYEIAQLNGKLGRKSGKTNQEVLRNGVLFSDGWSVENGVLFDGDGNARDTNNLPPYFKVGGVWYYTALDSKNDTYTIMRSSFQADTDHINPRAIDPPAAMSSDGRTVADYCLIGERVWGRSEDGMWADLDLDINELNPEDIETLGLTYDPLADDDSNFTEEDMQRVQDMMQGVIEAVEGEQAVKSIEGRKVG